MLALAAAVERESEHTLTQADARAADEVGVEKLPAAGFRNVAGHGAIADVEGCRVIIGNRRLMEQGNVSLGDLVRRREEVA